ncbi:hypothetical protein A3K72_00385 [Candidatus Woesearchaeota archaeon RBG_13_36_6]|nr:MAG: hypothetical protein A3K72_00385 [Candidatus Woesearchaeota archaeon RBG_13_36_6]
MAMIAVTLENSGTHPQGGPSHVYQVGTHPPSQPPTPSDLHAPKTFDALNNKNVIRIIKTKAPLFILMLL